MTEPKKSEGEAAAEETPKECPQCAEYKTGWQRAVADYQNLHKEVARQRGEWAALSETEILREFIPVYDNFKLAFRLQHSDFSSEQKKLVDGIGYIMKQFDDVLKAHGVEEIKTVGEKFDPLQHEVVSEEMTEGAAEEGMIVRELEGGYSKKGKVLRVAKVVVAKGV